MSLRLWRPEDKGLSRGLVLEFEGYTRENQTSSVLLKYSVGQQDWVLNVLHKALPSERCSWRKHPIIRQLNRLKFVVLFRLKATFMRTAPVHLLGTGCTFFFSTAILFVFSANTMFKKARGKKGHYSLYCSGPGERMSWWSSLTLRVKVYIFSLQVHWTVKWITAKYIFDAFCLFIMCWQVVLIVYLARILLIC